MDDKSFNIRVPKRWVRVAMIVGVTALIVAPLTAIATHSFTDVPNSNTFHLDIEWMKDSGVTKGCNPPANTEYCPDDNVTRGQMAAFMNRFAGYIGATDGTPAQADNATTATDADTLDGFHASDLIRAAGSATDSPGTGPGIYETIVIDAPVDGMLYVNAVAETFETGFWGCHLVLNGDRFPVANFEVNTVTDTQGPCPISGATAVQAGTQTIELEVVSIGTTTTVAETSLSGLFVPFGGDGAQPTSFMTTGHGNASTDESAE